MQECQNIIHNRHEKYKDFEVLVLKVEVKLQHKIVLSTIVSNF